MNGDTITEIKVLLSEKGAIKAQTALRLSLDIQAQIYESMARRDEQMKVLECRVEKIEKSSIIIWMQSNPKLTLFIATVYLLVSQLVDIRLVLSQALGL